MIDSYQTIHRCLQTDDDAFNRQVGVLPKLIIIEKETIMIKDYFLRYLSSPFFLIPKL